MKMCPGLGENDEDHEGDNDDVFVKMSPRILESWCIWVLMTNPNLILQIGPNPLNTHTLQIIVPFSTNRSQIILHNVHAQARVLSCGGGGV